MATAHFYYTGGWQVWSLPAGVTQVFLTISGGASNGVRGGGCSGMVSLAKGSKLYVMVAGGGGAPSGSTGGRGGVPQGGAGGNGSAGYSGGWGGAGYSAVRLNASSGTLLGLAGGAGGTAGKVGTTAAALGGMGGTSTSGQDGAPQPLFGGKGATSTKGGDGGAGTQGTGLVGGDGIQGYGGAGGRVPSGFSGPGGGGGGAGQWGGGGGVGGVNGVQTAGGGGGGINYRGSMTGGTDGQGTGGTGAGGVQLDWDDPATPNRPPLAPLLANCKPANGSRTLATDSVVLQAYPSDPDGGPVRAMFRISTDKAFSYHTDVYGAYVLSNQPSTVRYAVIPDRLYWVRAYSQDSHGLFSTSYTLYSFYSDFTPLTPGLYAPADGAVLNPTVVNTLSWVFKDPDGSHDAQNGAFVDYRRVGTSSWVSQQIAGTANNWAAPANIFLVGTSYQWRVRTFDKAGLASPASEIRSFTTTGATQAPIGLTPKSQVAFLCDQANTVTWKFRDPNPGDHQTKADFQWREVGTATWNVIPGIATNGQSWTVPANTFQPNLHVEWQVRTYDSTSQQSSWSASLEFYTIYTPGGAAGAPDIPITYEQGALGCGEHRVFIYDRGAQKRIGEVTPLAIVSWNRARDDISVANITTTGFDSDCCELLSAVRSMRHEIVIFRNGVRVWEGPITRVGYFRDHVEIEAKDVMQYVYRRIMRAGYNDTGTYSITVVQRAASIIIDALARDDPNVLAYLTQINYPDDAQEARVRYPYQVTAWEEVDDMAAMAGLDYVVVGRRILLWDTNRPIGRLPLLQDSDFANNAVVTEYGMDLGTYFAATNNQGVWGAVGGKDPYYGWVEQLDSSYSESSTSTDSNSTPASVVSLQRALTSQAERNSSSRNPAPLVVRIPDNTALSPDVALDIQMIVPGVWLPLSSGATCRVVTQWQKLDSMAVREDDTGEQVTVVMSPAPGAGVNPDDIGTLDA
jgi:hypothetical protein